MRAILILAILLFCPVALAQDLLVFDIDKLCKWQNENNSMDIGECTALEQEGKTFVEANAATLEPKRDEECKKEVASFAADPGVASYAIYADCLKNGPDSLNVAPSP
jgi:hypothetical protein